MSEKNKTEIILPEQAGGAVVPVDVDTLVAMVDAFDKFKSKVLKDTDFWVDTREKKRRVKKSGWLKYALACNVSLKKVEEREVDKEMPPGSGDWVTNYHFDYRAIAPSGRYAEGSGSASTSERSTSDKMIHDTRSLAQTRAMNRAISNLVGGGEVSAEEVMTGRRHVESKQTNKKKKKPKPKLKPGVEEHEKRVRDSFAVNDLDIEDFDIYLYGKNVVVKPPKDIDQEDWGEYHTVMERLKAQWDKEAHQWTVPIDSD